MNSIVVIIIAFIFFLYLVVALNQVLAQDFSEATTSSQVEKINSFELFWPIAAGKVMGDPLYSLKSFKESLRELFIFSDLKKGDYNISLSEKRVVEAEKLLLEVKDYQNAQKTLDEAQRRREMALNFIKKGKNQDQYVVDLEKRLEDSLSKQRALLHYISTYVPEIPKSMIDKNVNLLNEILGKL